MVKLNFYESVNPKTLEGEAEKEPTVNPDAIDLDSDDDSDEVRNFNQWTLKKQFSIIIISEKNLQEQSDR